MRRPSPDTAGDVPLVADSITVWRVIAGSATLDESPGAAPPTVVDTQPVPTSATIPAVRTARRDRELGIQFLNMRLFPFWSNLDENLHQGFQCATKSVRLCSRRDGNSYGMGNFSSYWADGYHLARQIDLMGLVCRRKTCHR